MATFVYRCPNTGRRTQGWSADEVSDETDTYEAIRCTACLQLHFVNRTTGKVLGAGGE
jgi:DNA-directed RNA polymerase subunit RPC12/RpoP